MKKLLIFFIGLLLTSPCLAEHWFCVKNKSYIYISDEPHINCKSYSSLKLKKPIVNRSSKKYKNIVETFDDRRLIKYCINN